MSALALRTAPPRDKLGWSWPLYGGAPLVYLGTLAASAPRVTADGYDGVGYVLALSEYDLGRGQPHPPGAPLFVLTGRLFAGLGLRKELALAEGQFPVLPWLALDEAQFPQLLIFAALPPAVLNVLVAEQYRQEPERVASIVLIGNLGSLVVLPAALWFALPH